MLIGELAERTGLSAHTIRFYEKIGLLGDEHAQRGANNYRYYSEEAATRLLMIRLGQTAGFTLTEIRSLIVGWENGTMTRADKEALIEGKLAEIDRRIAELSEMKTYLRAKLALLDLPNDALAEQFAPRQPVGRGD